MAEDPAPVQASSPETIEKLFTRSDGAYLFARWGRPMAPVVFGVEPETLSVLKGALEAVAALTGRPLVETDPELGTNLMFFFLREWEELTETPGLDRLIPELDSLVTRLKEAGANQYRIFRFDPDGAIRACFAFIRMDDDLRDVPAEPLALTQAVQVALLWSDTAFLGSDAAMLARSDAGHLTLRPHIAAVLTAAYDPAMPDTAQDASHALRLFARLSRAH